MSFRVKVLIGTVLVFGYLMVAGATAKVHRDRHPLTVDCTEAMLIGDYRPYDRCEKLRYKETDRTFFAAMWWPAYWALSLGYSAAQ